MFPELKTERLILRELTKKDINEVFTCFSNEAVLRYYGQEPLACLEHAGKFIEFFASNYQQKKGILWGIERKDTKGIIGTIGIDGWSQKHKRAEIGFAINPEHWRKGYAAEAIEKVLAYSFEILGVTRMGAFVFLENQASMKLLEKVGFKQEGVLRDFIYQGDRAYDTYVYSIIKKGSTYE